ncbi:MAG: sodium:proton antiporter [Desulforhopalus sp.]
MDHHETLIIIAGSFAVCTFCQWFAWRVRLPAIIFLLLAGIIAGPVFHFLDPDKLMGDLFFPFVSLSVAIILFEGSLTLKFREIPVLQSVVRNMLSFGLAITWLITTVAARFAIGVSWELAFLFGAITVVTGPTVIAPLLRTVRPTAAVAKILRWEGIVIDPIGASLSVLVYEFIISSGGQQAWGNTLLTFGQIILVGMCIGVAGGYFFGLALRNHWLPEFLQNVATLGVVFFSFVLADTLQAESGLVAVTVLGMWLANMPGVDLEEILEFKENLSVLLISLLFLMLAARLDISSLKEIGWAAVLVFLAVQFLARPLNVMTSTLGSQLSFPERYLLAWIAPRGIVAASIASLFAIRLEQAGFTDARFLVPLTFTVIIGTVLLQGTTVFVARWLGVALPEPRGFLFVGANSVARKIAHALVDSGVRVLLADTDMEKISKAKLEGLETYFGNPISVHADRHINLTGIGRMLALSPNESKNVATVMYYRSELGRNSVYGIQSIPEENRIEKAKLPVRRRGKILFGSDVTYDSLASALSGDGEIRTTTFTEKYTFEMFEKEFGGRSMPLFVIDSKKNVMVVDEHNMVHPQPGWTMISLFLGENNTEITESSATHQVKK